MPWTVTPLLLLQDCHLFNILIFLHELQVYGASWLVIFLVLFVMKVRPNYFAFSVAKKSVQHKLKNKSIFLCLRSKGNGSMSVYLKPGL